MRRALLAAAFAVFTLFDLPAHASPGPLIGQDMIGLLHPRFPAKRAARLLPDGAPVSFLDWTFGEDVTHLRMLLDTGKVPLVQIDLFNGPGLRRGQLGPYEPHARYGVGSFSRTWEQGGGKLRRHLAARVKLYCRLFDRYPTVRLEISPTLEHELSKRAFRHQMRVVRQNCPRAVVVNNPVGNAPTHGLGDKVERHGVKAHASAPCNVSLDGDDAAEVDVPGYVRRNRRCDVVFLWDHSFNCRRRDRFEDPRKRTACPTKQQLRELFSHGTPRD